jgi:uncharacterized lipoprotein NlpE involved in copper resistance
MIRVHLKLLMLLSLLFITALLSCNNDEDNMDLSTADLLIGTWITTDVDVTTSIGGQSVADYLVNVVGMSSSDAAVQESLLAAFLVSELTVTLTFNEDFTYESMFSGGMDSGTWSLSADERTLTLIEGGEEIIVTINSISTSRLNATLADGIAYDIDSNANTPDVTIDAEANLTMMKEL